MQQRNNPDHEIRDLEKPGKHTPTTDQALAYDTGKTANLLTKFP